MNGMFLGAASFIPYVLEKVPNFFKKLESAFINMNGIVYGDEIKTMAMARRR